MSGLYNVVFGQHPAAAVLAALIVRKQKIDPGRVRDVWVERDGDGVLIRVHTRNGGGNRQDYADEIDSMRSHPWFVCDEDLDFDNTYADFWFRPNVEDVEQEIYAKLMEIAVDPVDMNQRWNDAIEAIKGG